MKSYHMNLRTSLLTRRNAYFILLGFACFLVAYAIDRYYIFGEKDVFFTRPLELFIHTQ